MTIECRLAEESDAAVLVDFNCRLALESEDKELDKPTVQKGVQNGLLLGPEAQYFVAEIDDNVVGQLMITREWSDWRNGWIIWLQSVYVDAAHRRKGVFQTLFQFVRMRVEQDESVVGIRLYVESDNQPAIETYNRLGFEDSGYRVHELLFDR